MKSAKILTTLIACLGLLAPPAQALVTCTKTATPATSSVSQAADREVSHVARLLAGTSLPSEPFGAAYRQYVAATNDGWKAYAQNFRQPLSVWANKEIRQEPGGGAFYPFSGPDLPSVLTVYPGASRFVLISDQYANRYFDPITLKEPEQSRVLQELSDAWTDFGQRGFFVTQELNKRGGGERKFQLTPSMILMAFAARLGYEVRSIQPICLDSADLSIRPIETRETRWGSVRMELRKEGHDIVVDYLQQDLSNRGLAKHPEARALIQSLSKSPVLLKAASHLPQQPEFSMIRDAILTHSPLVLQDETGLEYDIMATRFNVRLYGEYVGAHRLFKEFINPSLVKAYKERAKDVLPLGFRLGYEKEAGSAIQVATRK